MIPIINIIIAVTRFHHDGDLCSSVSQSKSPLCDTTAGTSILMPSQVKSGVENIVPETHASMTNDRDFRTNLELNSLTSLLEIQQIENKNILSVIKT